MIIGNMTSYCALQEIRSHNNLFDTHNIWLFIVIISD